MKIKSLLLFTLFMLCIYSCRDSEEIITMNEEKMLNDYMEMLKKEFNLTMNKGTYYVKEEQLIAGNLIHNPPPLFYTVITFLIINQNSFITEM